jgi:hypothetical protein
LTLLRKIYLFNPVADRLLRGRIRVESTIGRLHAAGGSNALLGLSW